jgi:hypothetical protein
MIALMVRLTRAVPVVLGYLELVGVGVAEEVVDERVDVEDGDLAVDELGHVAVCPLPVMLTLLLVAVGLDDLDAAVGVADREDALVELAGHDGLLRGDCEERVAVVVGEEPVRDEVLALDFTESGVGHDLGLSDAGDARQRGLVRVTAGGVAGVVDEERGLRPVELGQLDLDFVLDVDTA